jgi:L-asparaginase
MRRDTKRHLTWIATGGTIAGRGCGHTYTAGALTAETLRAQWGIAKHDDCPIAVVTPYQIDSKDATPAHWHTLHESVVRALASPDCTGIVITHGTDTLEESAALLALTLVPSVPVVLTGAMRPADDPESDGEANFRAALAIAADRATPPGVWVAFAGKIFPALGVRKTHTCARDAFAAVEPLETATTEPAHTPAPASARSAHRIPPDSLPLPLPADWPAVPLLSCTAWDDAVLLNAAVPAAAAFVLLSPGNGSIPSRWHAAIRAATASGTPVIRASRCGFGPVLPHPIDDELGTWPAGVLSAAQARVAAALLTNATAAPEARQTLWRAIASGHVLPSSHLSPDFAASQP